MQLVPSPAAVPVSARSQLARVVIVGGGMGGIQAAKTLARAPVETILVVARNYYLFQPLVYEVANALLNVEDVAHSTRGLLHGRRNTHFRLGTACGVDWDSKELLLAEGERIAFDYLVLAAGLETDFRGVPGAAEYGLTSRRRASLSSRRATRSSRARSTS